MARITNGSFAGPAGRLEYILNEDPAATAPARAAIVCHPHPLHGGTMHTKIVFQTARELAHQGMPVLRFHFRGVGKSEGSYDHGEGEQQDLAAALAWMRARYPVPVVLAGFSFGSTMVIKTLARAAHPEVECAVLLGVPADRGQLARPAFAGDAPDGRSEAGLRLPAGDARSARGISKLPPLAAKWAWSGPKLMISGDQDEFASVESLEAYYAALAPPKARQWIAGGDHFMTGQAEAFRAALAAGLGALIPLGGHA